MTSVNRNKKSFSVLAHPQPTSDGLLFGICLFSRDTHEAKRHFNAQLRKLQSFLQGADDSLPLQLWLTVSPELVGGSAGLVGGDGWIRTMVPKNIDDVAICVLYEKEIRL